MKPEWKKMGRNVRKLVIEYSSVLIVPPGGGMQDAVAVLTTTGLLQKKLNEAAEWVMQKLAEVKAAHDNPYGDDDEKIAAVILEGIRARKEEQARARRDREQHG